MIDEDLYKIATDELNSGERNPEVWARACALASDDHDEARFLYTNLRVEEMLSTDGRKRTFSTSDQQRNANANNEMRSDALELEPTVSFGSDSTELSEEDMDSTVAQTESSRWGIDSINTLAPPDEHDSIEKGDLNAPTSAAGTGALSDEVVEFDDETMAEIAALSNESSSDSNAVATTPGNAESTSQVDENAADSSDIVANVFAASAVANREQILSQDQTTASAALPSPSDEIQYQSQTKSVDVIPSFDGDALPNQEDHDATIDAAYADSAHAANDDAASANQEISTHTARSTLIDAHQLAGEEDNSMDATTALDTGVGRSFMVFNRHGTLKSIKQGVSWPALIFTFPWLLSKALFGTAIVYGCLWVLSLGGLLVTANRWFIAGSDAMISIKLWTGAFAVLAIVGLLYIPFRYGNRWVAEKLQNRGFKYEGSVSAVNKLDAVDRLVQFNQENTL